MVLSLRRDRVSWACVRMQCVFLFSLICPQAHLCLLLHVCSCVHECFCDRRSAVLSKLFQLCSQGSVFVNQEWNHNCLYSAPPAQCNISTETTNTYFFIYLLHFQFWKTWLWHCYCFLSSNLNIQFAYTVCYTFVLFILAQYRGSHSSIQN